MNADVKKQLDDYDALVLKAEKRHQVLRTEVAHVMRCLTDPAFDRHDNKERMAHAAAELKKALEKDDESYR